MHSMEPYGLVRKTRRDDFGYDLDVLRVISNRIIECRGKNNGFPWVTSTFLWFRDLEGIFPSKLCQVTHGHSRLCFSNDNLIVDCISSFLLCDKSLQDLIA